MMTSIKPVLVFVLLLSAARSFSQQQIVWDGQYKLQLSDFQSPASQIGKTNLYSIFSVNTIDFMFTMSQLEFAFTKNFNSKVKCTFTKNASVITAPDSTIARSVLNFGRYSFDLSELYARKFRQKIYLEKGTFSSVQYIKPIYDTIISEYTQRIGIAQKVADLGRNSSKMEQLHQLVLMELEQLSDFCASCKPKKKK